MVLILLQLYYFLPYDCRGRRNAFGGGEIRGMQISRTYQNFLIMALEAGGYMLSIAIVDDEKASIEKLRECFSFLETKVEEKVPHRFV